MQQPRFCSRCGHSKPVNQFKVDNRKPSGRASICKTCAAAANVVWRKKAPRRKRPDNRQRRSDARKLALAVWRLKNMHRYRQHDRKWRAANPEKARAVKATRIARKRGVGGRHTGSQIKAMLAAQKCRCVGCRADISVRYHVDHIVPIALGGSNDISNIQLLCPGCNLGKRAKHPIDWARENGRLL